MAITSLLINVQLGQDNARLFETGRQLAERFGAKVKGLAVAEPFPAPIGAFYMVGDLIRQSQKLQEQQLVTAEAEFRAAFPGGDEAAMWQVREASGEVAREVASLCRGCDLLVTGSNGALPAYEVSSPVRVGEIIIQAGRPVMVVPAQGRPLDFGQAMIAWKNDPAGRRAIFDSLPLLQKCGKVALVEITRQDLSAKGNQEMGSLLQWLKGHGILAEAITRTGDVSEVAALSQVAKELEIGFLVAGTYARSRHVERLFGGVSWDIVLNGEHCAVTAH